MSKVTRNCDYCNTPYKARKADIRRGWGLCCSKSCAAHKREKSKPGYDPERVARNNERRENYGKEVYAKQRGYPSYKELEEDSYWNDGDEVYVEKCEFCGMNYKYCRCEDY